MCELLVCVSGLYVHCVCMHVHCVCMCAACRRMCCVYGACCVCVLCPCVCACACAACVHECVCVCVHVCSVCAVYVRAMARSVVAPCPGTRALGLPWLTESQQIHSIPPPSPVTTASPTEASRAHHCPPGEGVGWSSRDGRELVLLGLPRISLLMPAWGQQALRTWD